MIHSLHIKNFRGFEDHRISFRELAVVVGTNNAGKSTIVEALRLVSIIGARYRGLKYERPPISLDGHGAAKVVRPSLKDIGFSYDNLFYRHGDAPAVITCKFANGCSIKVFVLENQILASIFGDNGRPVRDRGVASQTDIPAISIMPQIEPLRVKENQLEDDTVRKSSGSRLFSSHFRNHLRIHQDRWPELQKALEATWPGVRLVELLIQNQFPPHVLHVEVRDTDFVAEIGTMGHGLQMWIQTLWFLVRAGESQTVILDEPDVYMHADLQRRLIRFIKTRFPQVIVTTHSVEIMSEVSSEHILVVDRRKTKSGYVATEPAVQTVVERMGSVHNLQLARLWAAKRLILVEGKDMAFLKVIQDKLFPASPQPINSMPNLQIGGWAGWNYAVGSSMAMKNSVGENIVSYCILDSDYHTEEEIRRRQEDAERRRVSLHIWSSKEIENYAVNAEVIARYINGEKHSGVDLEASLVEEKIKSLVQAMHEQVHDALANEYHNQDRARGISGANCRARERMETVASIDGSILSLVSGKTLISKLSEWSQECYGVSLNAMRLFETMRPEELADELKSVISDIEDGTLFKSRVTEAVTS